MRLRAFKTRFEGDAVGVYSLVLSLLLLNEVDAILSGPSCEDDALLLLMVVMFDREDMPRPLVGIAF